MTTIRINGRSHRISPDLSEWRSFFALTYSPLYGNIGISLFQGTPNVSAVDNALEASWDALYAYFRKKDRAGLQEQYNKYVSEFRTEQDAFVFSYGIAREMQEYLVQNEFASDRITTLFQKSNGDTVLKVIISELEAVKRIIFDKMDMERTLLMRLRESAGEYRWLGLAADGKPPSTVWQVDTMIEGKPLIFTGSTRPRSATGKMQTPQSSGYTGAIWCGLIHAFENQSDYQEETAIRAAFFEHLVSGRVDWEQFLSAAARAGIDPRLSDMSFVNGENITMWKKLCALKFAWDFFDEMYVNSSPDAETSRGGWGQPVGRVVLSAHYYGKSDVIVGKVKRYFHAHYQPFEGEGEAAGGVCFFPSTNLEGSNYNIAFVVNAWGEAGIDANKAMKFIPSERAIEEIRWRDDPILLSEDDKGTRLVLPEEMQFEDAVHPVISETTRSVETSLEAIGGGGFRRRTSIIDKVHGAPNPVAGMPSFNNKVKPSEMLETLLLGWRPVQVGNGVIRTNGEDDTRLDMFHHVHILIDGKDQGMDAPTTLGSALRGGS